MSERQAVSFKADDETRRQITAFEDKHGFENRSKALEYLVKAGLREEKTPLLNNWHQDAVQSAHYLMVAAIVSAVIGLSPAAFDWAAGAVIGAILLIVGLSLLTVVELARTVTGQSVLGAAIRRRKA